MERAIHYDKIKNVNVVLIGFSETLTIVFIILKLTGYTD